jgi:hypothetical protein
MLRKITLVGKEMEQILLITRMQEREKLESMKKALLKLALLQVVPAKVWLVKATMEVTTL